MNINGWKSSAQWGELLPAWPHLSAFIPGEDTKGPLNHDEVRSAIRLRLICNAHACVCVCVRPARMHAHAESQQASVFLLWECEASPSYSPGTRR